MTKSTCISTIDVCGARVAQLTEAGVPVAGETNGYASDAILTLGIEVTLKEGAEIEREDGCGSLRAILRRPDQISGLSLTTEFCHLDTYLAHLTTGATLINDGSDRSIGWEYPAIGQTPPPVCFEAWSKAWVDGAQIVDEATAPDSTWIHWVFPFTRWTFGNKTVNAADFTVMPVNAKAQENSQMPSSGPFDDWPTEIDSHGGITRLGGWFYDVGPDEVDCDWVEVTATGS